MRNIIVNAPIQNKDFSPDVSMGKVLPLFTADWLQDNDSIYDEQQPTDLWNAVLASEQRGHDNTSYAQLSSDRLSAKYRSELLTQVRSNGVRRRVLTDMDTGFHTWATTVIDTAVENGDITPTTIDMHVCNTCDTALSVAEGPAPRSCSQCPTHSGSYRREARTTLVTALDAEIYDSANALVGLPKHGGPTRLSVVNRKRLGGIELDHLGFSDEVVDPRIGLGLLALYAAIIQGSDTVDMVVSRSSAAHNLPQFLAATRSQRENLPALGLRQIVKAPVLHIAHLQQEQLLCGERFGLLMRSILPQALLTMKHDMSPAQLEQVVFSRKRRYLLT